MKSHFQTIALTANTDRPGDRPSLLCFWWRSAGGWVWDNLTDQHLTSHPHKVLALEEMSGKVDLAIVGWAAFNGYPVENHSRAMLGSLRYPAGWGYIRDIWVS